ncbi:hypothetical protein [Deferrisoma palaeochoriense]
MKRIVLFSLFSLLVFSGCATRYCHPTKTISDFERDKYDCEGVALQRSHHFGATANPFLIADEMKRCLEIKHGWRKCSE